MVVLFIRRSWVPMVVNIYDGCIDVEKIVTKKKKAGGKTKSTNIIPIVTQNSKQYDLNYFKQLNICILNSLFVRHIK